MKNNTINMRRRKIDKAMSDKTYEYCSICWTRTSTKKKTPIALRNFYVEGVGQLCSNCFRSLVDSP